ncbi:hypothetical protein ACWT_3109 [Actinoplanes sp. SE50]|uniref:RIP homotypic interaction motif-containing protein n=1 Tax=unclassified Actinoplanes TaxID=2626549 RepID=UPI00023EC456|nr:MULTISPECIES: RIP homotypic interaction motif-containing protein [unclassified Actinoplanes]AEV84132.1 hypothetical protein ACPL_3237 [Actinoplanes sp. SE50/110]ATO82524.1 hypothetical protein ACWT_3109 [Actinoplanes sp. SE50]SLL99931.1 hypothetical protein ACSP50_3163 [Actinoplanes sp. SE50/110]
MSENVKVISEALGLGATAGPSSDAVLEAYRQFKKDLFPWVRGDAREALAADETDPGFWEVTLGSELTDSGAAEDAVILAAARRLAELVKAPPAAKYTVTVSGSEGVQIGDHNTQTNTFGAR